MDLYIATPTQISKEQYIKNFGNINTSLWNVAVMNAPYKTGNLRLNIKKSSPSLNKTFFVYDDLEAAYVNFLEEGIGRNKRHVGFIENRTLNAMLFEIDYFFVTGKTSFAYSPSVMPRTDKLRNYERKMAERLGFSVNTRINASERASLSFGFRKGYKRKRTNDQMYKNISSPMNKGVQYDRTINFKPWGSK